MFEGVILTVLRYLYGFEEYCRSAHIQFRTIHHNEPRPLVQPTQKVAGAELKEGQAPPMKTEPAEEKAEAESESESDKEEFKDTLTSPRVSVY